MQTPRLLLFFCCLFLSSTHVLATVKQIDIIAHRGASGFLPEHTKEALVMSFMQGADYIEQDLVATKDGHLVVLHDIHLDTVTNVEQIFADRIRSDGRFYVIDFTLAELRSLRVHERKNKDRSPVFSNRYRGNAHFTIATFAEHVELVRELNRLLKKHVGIYPEIKAPAWHQQEGINITQLFIEQVRALALDNFTPKMYVQSFDPHTLKHLNQVFEGTLRLIQLIGENAWNESITDYRALKTDEGLADIAQYAQGIGPWLPHVIDLTTGKRTGLMERAQAKGLLVHPYTFRTDIIEPVMSAEDAFTRLKEAGIDGLFTDHVMPYMH